MKAATIESVSSAFDSGGGISPNMTTAGLFVVSLGLLVVFGIFIILKKANRGGEDEEKKEFFKIVGIFIITLLTILLYSSIATIK